MEGLRPQGYTVTSAVFKVTMMGHPVEYVVLQFRDILRRLVSHALAFRLFLFGGGVPLHAVPFIELRLFYVTLETPGTALGHIQDDGVEDLFLEV
jgi:hypothetical protein